MTESLLLEKPAAVLNNIGGALLDIVYPRSCEGCGEVMQSAGHLCWECLRKAEKVAPPFCEKCGDPVDGRIEGVYECSSCLKIRPKFNKARSVFRYRGPIMNAVHKFKYCGGVHLAGEMAEMMAALVRSAYSEIRFDLILGVPLFSRKERERGYNQAGILARGIARRIKVDCFNRAAVRSIDTSSQTEFKSSERRKNVKGAFYVNHPDWLRERNVLLVDDVMTTGATVAEVSAAIRDAGALSVYVVTFARG